MSPTLNGSSGIQCFERSGALDKCDRKMFVSCLLRGLEGMSYEGLTNFPPSFPPCLPSSLPPSIPASLPSLPPSLPPQTSWPLALRRWPTTCCTSWEAASWCRRETELPSSFALTRPHSLPPLSTDAFLQLLSPWQ